MNRDYVIRLWRVGWVLLAALLSGCPEKEPPEPGSTLPKGQRSFHRWPLSEDFRRSILALETALEEAQTDQQKWQIVVGHYQRDGDASLREQLKGSLTCASLFSDVVWACYPGIRRKFDWTVTDLGNLGFRIDAIHHGDGQHASNHPQSGIRAPLLVTRGLSREILYHLTGERFASREAFTTWSQANKGSLRWDKSLGRFRSSPSTTRRSGPAARPDED